MKIKKIIKQTLINMINQVQVTGNPDSKQFQDSLEAFKATKEFIEKLEEE